VSSSRNTSESPHCNRHKAAVFGARRAKVNHFLRVIIVLSNALCNRHVKKQHSPGLIALHSPVVLCQGLACETCNLSKYGITRFFRGNTHAPIEVVHKAHTAFSWNRTDDAQSSFLQSLISKLQLCPLKADGRSFVAANVKSAFVSFSNDPRRFFQDFGCFSGGW
jgi:hypothetical protein